MGYISSVEEMDLEVKSDKELTKESLEALQLGLEKTKIPGWTSVMEDIEFFMGLEIEPESGEISFGFGESGMAYKLENACKILVQRLGEIGAWLEGYFILNGEDFGDIRRFEFSKDRGLEVKEAKISF